MTAYISILRGINVSGQKMIRMEELKTLYEGLGFSGVRTFIQSGNVIFKTGLIQSISGLSGKIEKAIGEKYHFHVPVIIRTSDEMMLILSSNPFLNEEGIDREKLHVTFLDREPPPANVSSIQKIQLPADRFRVIGKEVYLYCPGGYGGTKLSNAFFENRLLVKATTRNWNTVCKLVELSGEG